MWTLVHMQEHHPHKPSDWRIVRGGFEYDLKTSSLYMKDASAFSRDGNAFTTYDVKLIGGRIRKAVQTLSLLASLSILLG